LDTDKNGLIDALEFVSSVAAISGMRLHEIIEFILTCYDFDGTQLLSIDEVTLALKSVTTGLCKFTNLPSPREELIEQLVSTVNIIHVYIHILYIIIHFFHFYFSCLVIALEKKQQIH
jgi:Ca2+-binding EF-hand superfamily protein